MKTYGVVSCGGRGERFGSSSPKQYQIVMGKPSFIRVLQTMSKTAFPFDTVALVMDREKYEEDVSSLIKDFNVRLNIVFIGAERTCTGGQKKAMRELIDRGGPGRFIITNAVNPAATADLYNRVEGALETGSDVVVPYVGMREGVYSREAGDKDGKDEPIISAGNKYNLIEMQVPIGLSYHAGRRMIEKDDEPTSLVDEALEDPEIGSPHLIEGEPGNIKMTYPDDLFLVTGSLYHNLLDL